MNLERKLLLERRKSMKNSNISSDTCLEDGSDQCTDLFAINKNGKLRNQIPSKGLTLPLHDDQTWNNQNSDLKEKNTIWCSNEKILLLETNPPQIYKKKNIHRKSRPSFGSSKNFIVQLEETCSIPMEPFAEPINAIQVMKTLHKNLASIHSMRNFVAVRKTVFSAVALILRPRAQTLDMLLVKRADTDWDVFSGEICLPGGLYQKEDKSLFNTVIREVKEELNLDLRISCKFVGQIPSGEIMTVKMGDLLIRSIIFVFEYIEGDIIPDYQEICAAAWVDCSIFWRERHELMKKLILPLENIISDNSLKEKLKNYNINIEAPNVLFSSIDEVNVDPKYQRTDTQWLIWGFTLQLVMSVFQIGASIPPLFPYTIASSDREVNQIFQYNWAFSKAFVEAAWNSNSDEVASLICNSIVKLIIEKKELKESKLQSKL